MSQFNSVKKNLLLSAIFLSYFTALNISNAEEPAKRVYKIDKKILEQRREELRKQTIANLRLLIMTETDLANRLSQLESGVLASLKESKRYSEEELEKPDFFRNRYKSNYGNEGFLELYIQALKNVRPKDPQKPTPEEQDVINTKMEELAKLDFLKLNSPEYGPLYTSFIETQSKIDNIINITGFDISDLNKKAPKELSAKGKHLGDKSNDTGIFNPMLDQSNDTGIYQYRPSTGL